MDLTVAASDDAVPFIDDLANLRDTHVLRRVVEADIALCFIDATGSMAAPATSNRATQRRKFISRFGIVEGPLRLDHPASIAWRSPAAPDRNEVTSGAVSTKEGSGTGRRRS